MRIRLLEDIIWFILGTILLVNYNKDWSSILLVLDWQFFGLMGNMKTTARSTVLFYLLLLVSFSSMAQTSDTQKSPLRLGVNYGLGSENIFPFKSKDYDYTLAFYKLQIMQPLKDMGKWNLELLIEPSLFIAEHTLLNEFYVQPRHGPDYLEQRVELVKPKQINEYALGVGLLFRHKTFDKVNTYILGSVGPMVNTKGTERLAEGFAFSDVLALGMFFSVDAITLDLRGSLRHVSNFRLKKPNAGYNSVNLEIGCTFSL